MPYYFWVKTKDIKLNQDQHKGHPIILNKKKLEQSTEAQFYFSLQYSLFESLKTCNMV